MMKHLIKSFHPKRWLATLTLFGLALLLKSPGQPAAALWPAESLIVPKPAHAGGLAAGPVVTSTLVVDWLPAAEAAPPITDEPGILKTAGNVGPVQTASLFFDDDDFFHKSNIGLRDASGGAPSVIPDYTRAELSRGANGFAMCPKGATYCAPRDGARAAGGSNGAGLTPAQQEQLRRLFRKPTVDDVAFNGFGLQNPSDAQRFALASVMGHFDRPGIGRTAMPQANAPQFGNQFNVGVGPNNRAVRPLNQVALRAGSQSVTPLGPRFRNQLDSHINRPGMSIQPLAGPRLTQPNPPQNAPCRVAAGPVTQATFVNRSSRYALITWVNFACQEIKYALVPPNRIHYQQSYLNYLWRVRDAQTLQLVGQVRPTAANPRPVFQIFNTGRTAEATASGEMAAAQTEALQKLGELADQFQQLGDRQVDRFYGSSQLATLRAERIRLTYYFIYTDPVYIYVEQELEAVYRQIYTTRPAYNYTVNLAAAIDSWTDPPANSSIAKTRFIQRQALVLWQDQLENEVGAYLQANPALSKRLTEVELWLMQRYEAIRQSGTVKTTAQEWLTRYAAAYNNSLNPLRAEAAQFMAGNPKFKQYVQLRDQIAELFPQFENHPVVDELIFQIAAVDNSPAITQAVNQAYAQYLNRISAALDQSAFDEESEIFYAQLNRLIKTDPSYQQLRSAHTNAMQALQGYLKNVHAAVANCYAWYGSNCNPYSAPNVQAVVNHAYLWQLLAPLAEAHDAYSRYWHAFYQRADYQNLQATAQARMQAAQAPVLPLFEQARRQFEQQVKAIPQIQQLETKLAQAVAVFRGQGRAASAEAAAGYPYAELDRKLNQLARLERELTGQTGGSVFLPLVLQ